MYLNGFSLKSVWNCQNNSVSPLPLWYYSQSSSSVNLRAEILSKFEWNNLSLFWHHTSTTNRFTTTWWTCKFATTWWTKWLSTYGWTSSQLLVLRRLKRFLCHHQGTFCFSSAWWTQRCCWYASGSSCKWTLHWSRICFFWYKLAIKIFFHWLHLYNLFLVVIRVEWSDFFCILNKFFIVLESHLYSHIVAIHFCCIC